jgi:hypothetical protein
VVVVLLELVFAFKLVAVELLSDQVLGIFPFRDWVHRHSDLLLSPLLSVWHRTVDRWRFFVNHGKQVLHLRICLILIHRLRLHLLHDLPLKKLEVILRDARSALRLLIVHRVEIQLGVQRLLIGLLSGAVALSHLQLTHLV